MPFSLIKEINWHPIMKESDFFVPRWYKVSFARLRIEEKEEKRKKGKREKMQRNLWIFVIRGGEQNVARVSKKKIPAARRLRPCVLIRKIRAILNSVPNIRSRRGEIFAKVGRAEPMIHARKLNLTHICLGTPWRLLIIRSGPIR